LSPAAKAARRALSVLVVDDNLDQVHSLAYLLKDDGHHVDFAINATVALDLAKRLEPQVVLLDIGLPDAAGTRVVGLMRRMPQLAKGKARIIAITGRDTPDAELMAAGFDAVLRKPVLYPELEKLLGDG